MRVKYGNVIWEFDAFIFEDGVFKFHRNDHWVTFSQANCEKWEPNLVGIVKGDLFLRGYTSFSPDYVDYSVDEPPKLYFNI